MGKLVVFLIAWLIIPSGVRAAEVEVSVDRYEIGVGEEFSLVVRLMDADSGSVETSEVDVPGLVNFENAGTSTRVNSSTTNEGSRVETVLTYSLRAEEEGEYVLGPVSWRGSESEAIRVQVGKQRGEIVEPERLGVGNDDELGQKEAEMMPSVEPESVEEKPFIMFASSVNMVRLVGLIILGGLVGYLIA